MKNFSFASRLIIVNDFRGDVYKLRNSVKCFDLSKTKVLEIIVPCSNDAEDMLIKNLLDINPNFDPEYIIGLRDRLYIYRNPKTKKIEILGEEHKI